MEAGGSPKVVARSSVACPGFANSRGHPNNIIYHIRTFQWVGASEEFDNSKLVFEPYRLMFKDLQRKASAAVYLNSSVFWVIT